MPTPTTQRTVLIAKGSADETMRLQLGLRSSGWTVVYAYTWDEVLEQSRARKIDVAILSPGIDGKSPRDTLHQLREAELWYPVLLIMPSLERTEVSGLTAGGDRVIARPYSLEDVAANLRALIRRTTGLPGRLAVGPIVMDEDSASVTVDGAEIRLRATEYDLLRFLMLNPDRVFSKNHLLDRVWPHGYEGHLAVVELYASYLRKKFRGTSAEAMFTTVRGNGYKLQRPGA